MTINQAGILRKEYFTSYFKLIMNAYNIDSLQAKQDIYARVFNNDYTSLGSQTYTHFLQAFDDIQSIRSN